MIIFIALAGLLAVGSAAQPVTIDRLGWLAGCWAQTRPDGVTEEHWMKPAGGTMLGMSRTVRDGRTTESEFLQIREVDGRLVYTAQPSGQAEATFPLKVSTERELVFENPAHDFPQRIIYRANPNGSMTARIEGTMNGQTRGVDFPFRHCS